MKECLLYILAFKDEPLIKVGFSIDTYVRTLELGRHRFDFDRSYVVQAKGDHAIALLERNIKAFFLEHRAVSRNPLPSGNTETFHCSIVPKILQAIKAFKRHFPSANFRIRQDLSEFLHRPERMKPEHQETNKLLKELKAWCDEPGTKGRRVEVAKLLGTPRQTITNWFKGRQQPTGEQALVVLQFLKEKRG